MEQKKLLALRVEELIKNGANTLSIGEVEEKVEKLAHHFYSEIRTSFSQHVEKIGVIGWDSSL